MFRFLFYKYYFLKRLICNETLHPYWSLLRFAEFTFKRKNTEVYSLGKIMDKIGYTSRRYDINNNTFVKGSGQGTRVNHPKWGKNEIFRGKMKLL